MKNEIKDWCCKNNLKLEIDDVGYVITSELSKNYLIIVNGKLCHVGKITNGADYSFYEKGEELHELMTNGI